MFTSDLIYEYLAREVNGTFGPRLPNRPVYSPSTSCAYSGFAKPPFLLFVPTLFYSLAFTQRPLSGATLHSPPHLPRRQPPGNHPPHSTANDHLLMRAVAEARPRLTVSKKSGIVVCVRTLSTIGMNVSDIFGTRESERCVSPARKLCIAGRTI